jgi:hypothetical protein
MTCRFRAVALLGLAACVQLSACSRVPDDLRVVATVGERQIDTRHLKRSYELSPQWRKGMTREEAHLRQLDYMVVNAMYAQEARREGLDRDSMLGGHIAFLRDKELIKALYEREIRGRVQISEGEYADGYRWLKRAVTFAFIYSPDSARAAGYARALHADSLPAITMLDPVADLKGIRDDVRYGELARELERPLFDGQPGDVAGPFPVREGFMVVKLLDGKVERFMSEMDFAEQKNKVRAVIGNRKADSLGREYISRLMRDKELTLNPGTFWSLAPVLARRTAPAQADPFGLAPVQVTDRDLARVEGDLGGLGNQVLATYRDGAMTVAGFIAAVGAMPPGLRPPLRSPQNLKDAVAIVVRNRYLAESARVMRLDADPGVRRDIEEQVDDALARAWLYRKLQAIPVTADDREAFRVAGGTAPDPESQAEAIRRQRLNAAMPGMLDQLRRQYHPEIDTTALLTMIPQPKERIGSDPTPFVVRELFQ